MWRIPVNVLLIWLLMAPPALCRAGVFVACCDVEQSDASAVVLDSPCCSTAGHEDADEKPAPRRPTRECGACAVICSNPAKPSDDVSASHHLTMSIRRLSVVPATPQPPGAKGAVRSWFPLKLPIPPSDVPLLI